MSPVTPHNDVAGGRSHFHDIFPSELLDQMVGSILQPRDLIPLALADKRFHQIVAPYHLKYRYVKCWLVDGHMWQHLSENPRRLAAVRFLYLEEPPHERVPRIASITDARSKQVLQPSLLARMVDLHSFRWNRAGVPGEMSVAEGDEYRRRIWAVLARLPHLKEVKAEGWFDCNAPIGGAEKNLSPASTLMPQLFRF